MSSNLEIGSFLNKKSIIPPLKLKKLLYEYNVPKEYELITNLNVN